MYTTRLFCPHLKLLTVEKLVSPVCFDDGFLTVDLSDIGANRELRFDSSKLTAIKNVLLHFCVIATLE